MKITKLEIIKVKPRWMFLKMYTDTDIYGLGEPVLEGHCNAVEAVIREEPHHIFMVTMGSDTEAAKESFEEMLRENAAWNTLKAVQEDRVHIMDKKLFNLKPNGRWAEAYQKLYETLTEE